MSLIKRPNSSNWYYLFQIRGARLVQRRGRVLRLWFGSRRV
jgi:hypothetical protein